FVYESELHESSASISHREFSNLAIEGEIAVRLGADLEPESVMAVIELHNLVLRSTPRSLQELIANNGIHAGVVLPPSPTPWGDRPESGSLRVFADDRLIEEADMYGVPGGPEGSLEWLKRHLQDHGLELGEGMLILTGTPLGMNPVRPGDKVRVEADGLEPVEMTVVA
ncbi:MAG TPA: fumarylacetoacetate hydrolase family protein, partial [Actinomycetota bacterium]|nr:fumarylacetoacetate hydrolase family protein [Actinomycetota bacterium]